MATRNVEFRQMLRHGFTAEEMAFLEEQPRFSAALEVMHTLSEFERVCELGQKLLAERGIPLRTPVSRRKPQD